MITLNLLPDIKREFLRTRRAQARVISIAVLVSIAAIALLVVVALWVYGVQAFQKSSLTASINNYDAQLRSEKDINKYLTIQNQLANISNLHSSKPILSRVFDVVSKLNPKAPNNVKVSTLEVDVETTSLIFSGETATYTGLETFRDTLKNAQLTYQDSTGASKSEQLFSAVTIDSQGLGKTGNGGSGGVVVGFKMTAVYNPIVFSRDTKQFAVNVPSKDTTQSKQDTPDIFGAKTITEGTN